MATVQTIINRAGRLLGQLASNTDMGTDESADALVALNALISTFANEELMCYATQTESLTLSASTVSYTIGPGGTLSTTRPVAIEDAWVDVSSISYPVMQITDAEYDAIQDKTVTSDWPIKFNYRPTMSTGTLYVYQAPNATRTMKLRTRVVVAAFSAVSDSVTLPPGWEQALACGLAIALAPEYETQASPEVIQMASAAKAAIKRVNSQPIKAYTELPALVGRRVRNIQTDT